MTVDFKPEEYMRETQAVREKKLRDSTYCTPVTAMKRKNLCWRATDALQGQDNSNKTLSNITVF